MGATDNTGADEATDAEALNSSAGGDTAGRDTGAGDTAAGDRPTGSRSGAALRTLVGACTLVGGLTWLLLNMHGPRAVVDVLVGVVLAAGGLVLLMPHRVRLPRRWTAVGMALTALVGTLAGLASVTEQVCCAFVYAAGRGFPFHWVARGAQAGTAETARNLARGADWQVDVVALAGDLLFWALVGLLAVVAVDVFRRRPERTAR